MSYPIKLLIILIIAMCTLAWKIWKATADEKVRLIDGQKSESQGQSSYPQQAAYKASDFEKVTGAKTPQFIESASMLFYCLGAISFSAGFC